MPTLMRMLREYPKDWVLNRYIQSSREEWSKGYFYLGGQVKLGIDDEITWMHLAEVQAMQVHPEHVANSWEMNSIQRNNKDFLHFRDIYLDYLRKKTYSGILRAIVFWLSPARKRAAEKVFHPDNLKLVEDEEGNFDLVPIKK